MNQHSLRVLEFSRIRETLSERTTCAAGRRAVAELGPVTDPEWIAERLAAVSEIRRVLEDSDLPIHGLPELEPVIAAARTEGAVLPGVAVAGVARSLNIARRMKAFLWERRETLPRLAARGQRLDALGELRGEIEQQVGPDGELLDRASPALNRIRRQQETTRQRLQEQLRRIVRGLASSDAEAVVTLRNDRYVVQVRRDRSGSLRGVVHGQSGSGASVYLEPASVVPANNELAELRSAEEEEVRRLLLALSSRIREHAEILDTNESVFAELDALYAAGKWSRDTDSRPALPSRNGGVIVRRGRHPLLEAASRAEGREIVPLDLELGGDRPGTLVITGPNTGGKTVALKTVGLFALLNQCGLHIPAAEGSAYPVFRDVFADIGDEQSIEASLSTFSSHMAHVNELLRDAGPDALVLLDELGVGTDPEDGAALGKAILGELTREGALTIVTTHYGSLKVFAHESDGMENASLEFDRESLSPTYTFLQGVPGSSEALAIAQRLGFPEHLVEEARRYAGSGRERIEGLLHDLQERRRELEEQLAELETERGQVQSREEQVERRLENLKEERVRIKRDAMEEARRLVDRSKAELTELLGAVKADGAGGRAAGRARTRLGEMGKRLQRGLSEATREAREPARPATPDQIREGTPVLIPSMGWKGTALGTPGSNGKVAVSVGSLRVEVPVSSLELRGDGAGSPGPARPAERVSVVAAPQGDARTEIDLRGRTVEEAVDEVDRALDGLVVAGGTWLRIIHGKGTGALRTAISEQLGGDGRIKTFRAGEPAEGGTGVTIAVLK